MKAIIPAAALGVLLATSAFGQTDPSQVGAVNSRPGEMTGEDFAEATMTGDLFEIQAGHLASQQGQSQAVRDFGQHMVQAHGDSSTRLKAITDHLLVGRTITPPPQVDPRRMGLYNQLQQARGEDFDRLYIREMFAAHREALAVMQGYVANGREPALRRFAADMTPVIRQHMDMLRQIRSGG